MHKNFSKKEVIQKHYRKVIENPKIKNIESLDYIVL